MHVLPEIRTAASALNVLLVDDDPMVLRSLGRLLRRCAPEIQVATANGGLEALAYVKSSATDVVITDINMPGMSGTELLDRMRSSHPDIVRIHLSGEQSVETAYRSVPLAHQFLAKPVESRDLLGLISNMQKLRELLQDREIRALVGRADDLPAVPRVYAELTQCLAKRSCSYGDVAKVIGQDIAISAALMKVASSSFFVRRCAGNTVEEAVQTLGLAHVRALVFTLGTIRAFAPRNRRARAWIENLQSSALLATRIAAAINEDDPPGHVTLAAMLHDVGQLVLMDRVPEKYDAVMQEVERTGRPLHTVEEEQLGVTHSQVGAYLLGLWGLASPIVWAVARHHAASGGSSLERTIRIAVRLCAEIDNPASDFAPTTLIPPESGTKPDELDEWRAHAARTAETLMSA